MVESPPSEVAAFFRGRGILVTGGTGFMGKVLLEKLLYACPEISAIYVLMRAKRDKTPEVRLEEMYKLPVFQRIQKESPDVLRKLVIVHGDLEQENLALSASDLALLQDKVSVVFHSAATLKLEAKLKDSVKTNLVGTWNVLQVAKTFKNLKVVVTGFVKDIAKSLKTGLSRGGVWKVSEPVPAKGIHNVHITCNFNFQIFVHSSTAFSHCDQEVLEERMYPAPYNPKDIMACMQWMDDDLVDIITQKLIHPHVNTYTFTKRLAERLVEQHLEVMPVAIARPSIVTPAWKEPVPGWVDSLNGPVGLAVGAGKGVIRSMYCNPDYYSEVITVDFAINGLITIAAKEGSVNHKPTEVPVYNLTAGKENRLTWGEALERSRRLVYQYPFEMTVWYPDGNIHKSKVIHNLCIIFLHFLPAYLIDFLMLIFRQKRFMVRIQNRIYNGLKLLEFFATRQWNFANQKFLALHKELNETDKRKFNMDVVSVDVDEFLLISALGARHYCLKEDPNSIPRCRRNIKILYVIDRIWSLIFYGTILWLILSYSESARYVLDTTGGVIKSMPVLRSVLN